MALCLSLVPHLNPSFLGLRDQRPGSQPDYDLGPTPPARCSDRVVTQLWRSRAAGHPAVSA